MFDRCCLCTHHSRHCTCRPWGKGRGGGGGGGGGERGYGRNLLAGAMDRVVPGFRRRRRAPPPLPEITSPSSANNNNNNNHNIVLTTRPSGVGEEGGTGGASDARHLPPTCPTVQPYSCPRKGGPRLHRRYIFPSSVALVYGTVRMVRTVRISNSRETGGSRTVRRRRSRGMGRDGTNK